MSRMLNKFVVSNGREIEGEDYIQRVNWKR